MTPRIQVGTILIEDRPLVTRVLNLETESYSAKWGVLKVLGQTVRSVGWNYSFMAEEVKATVFGSLAAKSIRKALKRIFLKVRKQDFNCLEVTKMVGSAIHHGLHAPPSYPAGLRVAQERRMTQNDAEWARA